jgi:hypothetical protein
MDDVAQIETAVTWLESQVNVAEELPIAERIPRLVELERRLLWEERQLDKMIHAAQR